MPFSSWICGELNQDLVLVMLLLLQTISIRWR